MVTGLAAVPCVKRTTSSPPCMSITILSTACAVGLWPGGLRPTTPVALMWPWPSLKTWMVSAELSPVMVRTVWPPTTLKLADAVGTSRASSDSRFGTDDRCGVAGRADFFERRNLNTGYSFAAEPRLPGPDRDVRPGGNAPRREGRCLRGTRPTHAAGDYFASCSSRHGFGDGVGKV